MARWWEATEADPEPEATPKTYSECPKCRSAGDPGTETHPWTWKETIPGAGQVERAMSTPLCSSCVAELANRRAPAYTGTSGGGGFGKYEFQQRDRGPKYEPYVGLLQQARSSGLNRGLPEVTR